MNERHAYKIPQLNKWGVIDSTVLEIEIPSTIDASFLNTIKSNPHARYLYGDKYLTFDCEHSSDNLIVLSHFGAVLYSASHQATFTPPWFTPNGNHGKTTSFSTPTNDAHNYNVEVKVTRLGSNGDADEIFDPCPEDYYYLSYNNNQITVGFYPGMNSSVGKLETTAWKIGNKMFTLCLDCTNPNQIKQTYWEESLEGGSSGGGTTVIVDGTLSKTSTNPVQNKTITNALNNKAEVNTGYQFHENEVLIATNDGECLVIGSGKTLSDFVSKDEKRTQAIVDLTEDNIAEVKEIIIQNPGALIRFHEYIYVPTYQELGETIPSYYSCFASDEQYLYYLTIYGDDMILETGGYKVPSFTDTQGEKLMKLLDTITIEEI